MKNYISLYVFIILFLEIKSTFYLSMTKDKVNEYISKIYNENAETIFEYDGSNNYPNPIVPLMPYEIGQKIFFDFYADVTKTIGYASFIVYINEYTIKTEYNKFWKCTNCGGENNNYIYNNGQNRFDFYTSGTSEDIINNEDFIFHFYFQISSYSELNYEGNEFQSYYYSFTEKQYFFLSIPNLDQQIDIINFNTTNIFYIVNNETLKTPFDVIKYKIYFDDLITFNGKFIGLNELNNDIELNKEDFFQVSATKGLRYKLSETEKEKKGIYLKIRVEAYNSPYLERSPQLLSHIAEFNFLMCFTGYKMCDIMQSFKCLNEGFYLDSSDNKYYSCYETCGTCDNYNKPETASYKKHYCDTCSTKYPYFINIVEEDENDNIIKYKNCYEECPLNNLVDTDSNECIACPLYQTNENVCVDHCDSKKFKYLLKDEKTCYNYIPDNYYIYIDNHDKTYYDNDNIPIIKLGMECPDNYSSDSNYIKICINLAEDIFYLIDSVNLIKYNNPQTVWLKEKSILVRAFTTDLELNEIIQISEEYPTIDTSQCENTLKNYYNINDDQSLIIYDINDLSNDKYKYKVYSKEGEELDINICFQKEVGLCKFGEYFSKNTKVCTKCPNECYICSFESVEQNSCIQCNNKLNFYKIFSPNTNNQLFLTCINEDNKPNNYHFNKEKLRYEPCYETCKECFDYGNKQINNCTSCINGYVMKEEKPNNCVFDCEYYYYFNEYDQYKCTDTDLCPVGMFLVKNKKKCIDDCKNAYPYLYKLKEQCVDKCPLDTYINNNKCLYLDNGQCLLYEDYLNQDINELSDNDNQLIDELVYRYALEHQDINSEIYNYKNKNYNFVIYKNKECLDSFLEEDKINITTIDFQTCYKSIQEQYSLKENIIIILIDIYRQNQSPYTFYNFYHPETGIQLNSEICSSTKVTKSTDLLSLGMDNIEDKKDLISQGIDIFNSSSPFYDDICFHFESPNGKDVPLKERILLYYPNITLCDDGCENKGIDPEKYKAKCECTFSIIINNDLINNPMTGEIINIIQEMNIEVVKCYKDVFKLEYFKKNTGSIIILILIFLQIIFNFIYYMKNVAEIRKFTFSLINSFFFYLNKMTHEIYKTSNENLNKVNNKIDNKGNMSNPQKKKKKSKKSKNSKKIVLTNNPISINKKSFFSSLSSKINLNMKDYKSSNKFVNSKTDKNINENKNNMNLLNDDINYLISYKELKNYMKISFDEMDYEEALIEDKRRFCDIYNNVLLNKQLFLNIIFGDDKYKPTTLKYIILILSINLYFVINGLFYSESYIDELYQINEKETFFSFIQRSFERIIYSSIAGVIVNFLINFIIIDGNKIKYILNRKNYSEVIMRGEIGKILFKIGKSINIFYIINYFIMVISWYYISCFNNVYSNTKEEWIKSSIFIIIIMQIIPFIYSLAIALLRYMSIHCKSEKMYKLVAGFS